MIPPSQEALEQHRQACEQCEDGYVDPQTGMFSPTSHFLRQRGSCCGLGCRHCPWPAEEQTRAGRAADAPTWPYP